MPEDPVEEIVLPDLSGESDDYLAALAAHVEEVQEERRSRATIPGLVASLAAQFEARGGDRDDLIAAVQSPPAPADESSLESGPDTDLIPSWTSGSDDKD